MLCSASPLVDTVMNSQAHCQGKLLHYTMAQWSLISLGGQHPGGSPDQRIYSGLEVPISLAIQSVQSPSPSHCLYLPCNLNYKKKKNSNLFSVSPLCVLITTNLHSHNSLRNAIASILWHFFAVGFALKRGILVVHAHMFNGFLMTAIFHTVVCSFSICVIIEHRLKKKKPLWTCTAKSGATYHIPALMMRGEAEWRFPEVNSPMASSVL